MYTMYTTCTLCTLNVNFVHYMYMYTASVTGGHTGKPRMGRMGSYTDME